VTKDSARAVRWPARYSPEIAPVHVRNELDMEAPPGVVWAWLIRAQLWPAWYENAAGVTFLDGHPPDLAAGGRFRWKTFGVTLESTVLEFVPGERIAWDARGVGVDAYHAWVITKTPRGSHVLTEETQHGWLARLGSAVMPHRMFRYHQLWLEGLRGKAAGGLPPTP
jgi:Polyketide cyclase / dehydrase and lipid transport